MFFKTLFKDFDIIIRLSVLSVFLYGILREIDIEAVPAVWSIFHRLEDLVEGILRARSSAVHEKIPQIAMQNLVYRVIDVDRSLKFTPKLLLTKLI